MAHSPRHKRVHSIAWYLLISLALAAMILYSLLLFGL